MFSGLSSLVIECVADEGELILVQARTPQDSVPCPGCGVASGRVHGYHLRTVADVSVDPVRLDDGDTGPGVRPGPAAPGVVGRASARPGSRGPPAERTARPRAPRYARATDSPVRRAPPEVQPVTSRAT